MTHRAAILLPIVLSIMIDCRTAALACPGDCDRDSEVTIAELVVGVRNVLAPALSAVASPTCAALDADRDGSATVAELIAAVRSALHGCPLVRVPFRAELDEDGSALLLTPAEALLGERTYSLVLTTGIRDGEGKPLQPAEAFRAIVGSGPPPGDGPVALFSADPEAAGNPYPDPRLLRADGTVHVPDRFALRGLDARSELDAARRILRETADEVGTVRGFGTTAPVRIALSALVDLDTVNAETVLFFQRPRGGVDVGGALDAAARAGVPAAEVALAVTFPTQPIENDLLAIRDLYAAAPDEEFGVILEDPDPEDDLPIGVFGPGELEDCDGAGSKLPIIVSGLLPTREFRAADGIFDPAKIAGVTVPETVLVRFLLAVPASPPPHEVVILQHGFAGSDCFVLTLAAELAGENLAAIGISSVLHGRRGNFFDLVSSTPLQLRDVFRQTHADQMALARAIRAGIDWNGDAIDDLDAGAIGYLGVSLGGIQGSTMIAVEPSIRAAVLNVTGGRVAFLGENPGARAIYVASFAERSGLAEGTPELEVFLRRMLELAQQGVDPADGLNYARRWRLEPFPGYAPRRVLMQEGLGDVLVSNESTEELAAAAGLPVQVAVMDEDGAAALWSFEGGHGILGRQEVRDQAVTFLGSDGTLIVDPRP
jgi:hypothetical protein